MSGALCFNRLPARTGDDPIVTLIILLSFWPFSSHPPLRVRHGVLHGWRYEQVDDRFTGGESCRLSRGPIQVSNGIVRLDFGRGVDTSDAVYRIDGQAARRWRDDIPVLTSLGVNVQRDDLANPSGGVVLLQLGPVLSAGEIDVRVGGSLQTHRFRLEGLSDAVQAATLKHCIVDQASH